MASLAELQDALRNADKAGDATAARRLADAIVSMQSGQPQKEGGYGRAALEGLRRLGVNTVGGGGDVRELAKAGLTKLGVSPEAQGIIGNAVTSVVPPLAGLTNAPTSQEVQSAVEPVVGKPYEPQGFGEGLATTAAEFLPGLAMGGGNIVERAIQQVAAPALLSETAGQVTRKMAPDYEPYARLAGALIAPTAAGRAMTPFPVSAERQRLAQTLTQEGVGLTAGQRTGSKTLRAYEAQTGGGGAARMMENQGEQFTRAALRRAGIDAPRATPEVMDQAFTRIGNEFDDLAANTQVQFDQQLQNDLLDATTNYQQTTGSGAQAPIIESLMNDAATLARAGTLDGPAYARLRTRITDGIRRGDSNTRGALQDMREALDDAVQRSLPPDMVDRWQTARNQYRNMLVLEQAATGAGENAAAGLISPSALRNATVQKHGRRNYGRGQGDFAELARAGEGTMKPLPDSGTALNTKVRNLGTGALSVIGGGAGAMHSPDMAMLGVLAGQLLPAGVGRLAMTGPVQAYLGNQFAGGDRNTQRLIAALLSQGGRPPVQGQ